MAKKYQIVKCCVPRISLDRTILRNSICRRTPFAIGLQAFSCQWCDAVFWSSYPVHAAAASAHYLRLFHCGTLSVRIPRRCYKITANQLQSKQNLWVNVGMGELETSRIPERPYLSAIRPVSNLDRTGHVRNFKRKSFLWTSFDQVEPHFDTISVYLSVGNFPGIRNIRFVLPKTKIKWKRVRSRPRATIIILISTWRNSPLSICVNLNSMLISLSHEEDDVGNRRPRVFQRCLQMTDASHNCESQCQVSMQPMLEFQVNRRSIK